ncbi:MAG TPA: hypothetical protein VFN09_06635 [Rhodanobacteraceae bacterium]|nr:hypothetical protein [Rhodanobacteraceae bacterium]
MYAMTEPAIAGRCTLAAGNRATCDALLAAISAVYHLDDAGCTVLDVELRGGKPVLRIDRPPAFVRGVATVTHRVGRARERRMVAAYHGAQIEWAERELPPPRQWSPRCA